MAKPTIDSSPSAEQHEARILQAVVDYLEAAVGPDFYYDSDGAYLVEQITSKHLAEAAESTPGWPKVIYFVQPGDLNITPDTGCTMRFEGDLLVTAIVKVGTPELPWVPGYVPVPRVQLRMFEDLYRAVNAREIQGATLFVADRNLGLQADGWAIVQVQVSLGYSEGTQGES